MRSMVYSNQRDRAMEPERSKPLHNFNLPSFKWTNQTHLKLDDDASTPVDSLRRPRRHVIRARRSSLGSSIVGGGMRRPEPESCPKKHDSGRGAQLKISTGEAAEGIGAVREEIMKDLKTAADDIMGAAFRDEVPVDEEFKETKRKGKEIEKEELPTAEVEETRPWNLRKRRAAWQTTIVGKGTNNIYSSPLATSSTAAADEKRPRPKFSVSLSKKEIEQDFMAITGRRPPGRPKKRARHVQKQLDSLFPGMWLSEVSEDSYKVPENGENGKR
ncbi:uncharacterized protein LOC120201642 [Hibiscus syriacus]|uniref:uncharacterized protein LOC120201642 n=1 Tax=Hibiscus syriacus TaxID=106335 RepID=UPI001922C6E5|nr:uncharacterized protein LOC120201642 [Hibiscus syriacus]